MQMHGRRALRLSMCVRTRSWSGYAFSYLRIEEPERLIWRKEQRGLPLRQCGTHWLWCSRSPPRWPCEPVVLRDCVEDALVRSTLFLLVGT